MWEDIYDIQLQEINIKTIETIPKEINKKITQQKGLSQKRKYK